MMISEEKNPDLYLKLSLDLDFFYLPRENRHENKIVRIVNKSVSNDFVPSSSSDVSPS